MGTLILGFFLLSVLLVLVAIIYDCYQGYKERQFKRKVSQQLEELNRFVREML